MPDPNNPFDYHGDQPAGGLLLDFFCRGMDAQAAVDATAYPASNIVTPSTTVPAPPEPQGIGYWCPQCQKWTNGFPCVIHFQPLPAAGLGWECPRCRAIYAPWVSQCGCPVPTITTTGWISGNPTT